MSPKLLEKVNYLHPSKSGAFEFWIDVAKPGAKDLVRIMREDMIVQDFGLGRFEYYVEPIGSSSLTRLLRFFHHHHHHHHPAASSFCLIDQPS